MFLPHPRVKVSIAGSLRDREVACSASDRQGSNFESCVWRTVSSQSSHHPQEVLLAQFSLYVHKGGLKPDSFHFISPSAYITFCRRMRAIAPKLDWREELVCKCRTNEASMIVVLIDSGGVAVTSDSRGFMSVALWIVCIVPSTWLRESGTGVSEY